MIDETAGSGGQSGSPVDNAGQTGAAGERVAFCQQCGRELTAETVRRAGAAVYCEPCLVARLGGAETGTYAAGTAGYTPVNGGTAAGYVPPATPDAPSPGLAALLGLIPGVGAMYNGQFAKGVAHLVIFAILVSLSDNVNGIFGLFVAGWVVYQSFEAYHTAKARRDGLPLPNAFGLNDIGDRFGFGRNWPGSASRPVTTAAAGAAAAAAPPPPPTSAWQANATTQTPNWAGYVPPTSFGATTTPPAAGATQQAPPPTGWTPGPYAPTYAGGPGGPSWAGPAGTPPVVVPPGRHFPVGAAWLIGLGLLFLLSNLAPEWRIAGRWLVPAVFAGLGSWLLYRRVDAMHRAAEAAGESDWMRSETAGRLLCQVRGPIMLLVLAVLFALQAAHVFTLGQTWPVLLVAFGALLLLERTMGRNGWYPPVGVAGAGWTKPEGESRKDGR